MRYLRIIFVVSSLVAVLLVPSVASADTWQLATLEPKQACGQPQEDALTVAVLGLRTHVVSTAEPGKAGINQINISDFSAWNLAAGWYQLRLVEQDCTSYKLGYGYVTKSGGLRSRATIKLAYGLEFCERQFRVELIDRDESGSLHIFATSWLKTDVCV